MGAKVLDSSKLERILHLYMAIKATPAKSPCELRQELGVEKSAYGRYCALLKGLGVDFRFDRKTRRHVIEKDAFLTAPDLALDERLAIILAVNEAALAAACSALLSGPEYKMLVAG